MKEKEIKLKTTQELITEIYDKHTKFMKLQELIKKSEELLKKTHKTTSKG